MTRNLKMLGVAVAAVLAMSAVMAATAAQAAAPEFHCTAVTQANCVVTGESNSSEFRPTPGDTPIRCTEAEGVKGARYKSTIPKTGTEATVTAEYGVSATEKGCKAFGLKATINMNGCDYKFTQVAGSSPATANVDINCPAGKVIEIKIPGGPCTVKVAAQGPLSHVVFTNEEGTEPTGVIAKVTVTGITSTTEGAGCPEPGGTHPDALHPEGGIYTDEVTLKGYEDTGSAGEYKEGNQVGLHVF